MGLYGFEPRAQIKRLVDEISERVPGNEPLLIAGDFNDWTAHWHRALSSQLDVREAYHTVHGRLPRTFPAVAPLLTMDRIYCRGFDLLYADCLNGKPWNTLSDHCALYADFQLAA